ncbi:unnamed protein product [Lymnaea stagnalis]|uniref:Hexosyltransferase n=1 Tax=Lymnaea stagnalis TaxID=6523 RepID=A0AAV2INW2_LYMST
MMYNSNVGVQLTFNQPQACGAHTNVLLLIIVHSTFGSYDKRAAIRETWGNQKNLKDFVPILFFVPAYPDSPPEVQLSLTKESSTHPDMVQWHSVNDNIFTSKLVVSTFWIKNYCSHASYVLTVEDASIVDVSKLLRFLKSLPYSWTPLFLCDYLSPNEATLVPEGEMSKPYCSSKAFLTTLAVLEKMVNALNDHGVGLKGAWLSQIADAASVKWTNTSQHFTSTRQKPSMINELTSTNYTHSKIMIALVLNTIEGREATIMRHVWKIIQEHYSHSQEMYSDTEDNDPSPITEKPTSNILPLAILLMFVDLIIVALIFLLIFCKSKKRVRL